MKKTVKAWAGLYKHNLAKGWVRNENHRYIIRSIFNTKREASQCYVDVVRCTITYEIPTPKEKAS